MDAFHARQKRQSFFYLCKFWVCDFSFECSVDRKRQPGQSYILFYCETFGRSKETKLERDDF